ncbi:MAG: GTPase Era, partial [Brevibacterium sp.]|nr:GTPase Era [Brevibacterium sp.]
IGPGDKYIASQLELLDGRTPIVALVTKTDKVPQDKVAEALLAVGALADFADVVPVSAVDGFQVDTVDSVLTGHLPVSPPLYPEGELTDEPEEMMIAELVREAALEGVRDELPHSLAAQVEEMYPREGRSEDNPLWNVHVNLFVERSSQKAIIIGKGGSRLKAIGSESRRGIEALLGTKVYLDLHVKIAKDWQRDPKQLGRLGFDFS